MRSERLRGMLGALRTGILVNLVLAAAKATAGIWGGSYALIADAVESAGDVLSSLLVSYALRIAAKPADANHPYGHGKVEPLAATAVALILAGAGAAIAASSITGIVTPQEPPSPYTLIALIVVIAVKETLYRVVVRAAEDAESGALRSDAWHHRSDAITSLAAFLGIALATWGGPAFAAADCWAALVASAVILLTAYHLLRPAIVELTDASPPEEIHRNVRDAARAVRGVLGLDKCYVRKMGFDHFVDIHVLVDGDASVREGHRIAHDVKDAIRHAMPSVADVLVHVEPYDSPAV